MNRSLALRIDRARRNAHDRHVLKPHRIPAQAVVYALSPVDELIRLVVANHEVALLCRAEGAVRIDPFVCVRVSENRDVQVPRFAPVRAAVDHDIDVARGRVENPFACEVGKPCVILCRVRPDHWLAITFPAAPDRHAVHCKASACEIFNSHLRRRIVCPIVVDVGHQNAIGSALGHGQARLRERCI